MSMSMRVASTQSICCQHGVNSSDQLPDAIDSLAESYRLSASILAAQMKSFSESPPIACVVNLMRQ